MPIYEFYCRRCNTVFNFFSKTVNTEKVPQCPRCKRVKLKRQMSLFARVSPGRSDPGEDAPPIDESRMEKAMAMLASEAGSINEDDPRQAARLMRKLSDATGLNLGAGMEEALSRMERGEDPEKIEEEMGDLMEGEEPFTFGEKARGSRKRPKPKVDEKLYDL
ncbi:MAG TPA: zinc ribbon domain-containing protein [Syntrophales bacterium]|nr:zinc ribbon domain-containing protein [Syntrophales bacterium]HRT62585.1 zinc ribbon domain-containing protein [Syntrophales bacterium]